MTVGFWPMHLENVDRVLEGVSFVTRPCVIVI